VRVWSPRNAKRFAEEFHLLATDSAEEAVRGADVIIVATTSQEPVLYGSWLSAGTHINAVGAVRPEWRELDDEVLRRAQIYVESREAALLESGDVIAADEITAEIGEILGGTRPDFVPTKDITLFKSVGVAVEDVVTADLVYRAALDKRGS
jgi:ornithine cyclodeaminase/alanine dehydrogenase-like protein (mu-crystallin family)